MYIPNINENLNSHKNLYMNVESSIIHNGKRNPSIQELIMDK
jgi:carboxypeptidase C (cathepsin A)